MKKQQPKPKKELRVVEPKVKLYPNSSATAKSVDSLKKIGYGKAIGNPIVKSGQTPVYGPSSSDVIKKALKKPAIKTPAKQQIFAKSKK